MTASTWITLAMLVVAVTVPFVVAALDRRQLRQIEMHREDPSIPIKPPLHPILKYINNHLGISVAIPMNLIFLIRVIREPGPITMLQVVSVALYIGLIFFFISG